MVETGLSKTCTHPACEGDFEAGGMTTVHCPLGLEAPIDCGDCEHYIQNCICTTDSPCKKMRESMKKVCKRSIRFKVGVSKGSAIVKVWDSARYIWMDVGKYCPFCGANVSLFKE